MREPGDHHDLLLEEYKLGVEHLTNHLIRLWTRFSFFLTLETALVVALLSPFKDGQLSRAAGLCKQGACWWRFASAWPCMADGT